MVSLACQQVLKFFGVVRRQKILSLAFMHSPFTCSANGSKSKKRPHICMEFMPEVLVSTWRLICGAVGVIRLEHPWNDRC